ncbi:hypothetical protein [Baaleninema simplex]|uniref:hypothetical protein n=1 Tax=Baaleninema simplex TaxID=2862350 RepID=UPI000346F121|nr:hypothetical protein [Baaleninema simplex]
MKFEDLKQRLRRDREMVSVTLEIPADVLADLERLAPLREASDAVALMRAYIGQGLREDLESWKSCNPNSGEQNATEH